MTVDTNQTPELKGMNNEEIADFINKNHFFDHWIVLNDCPQLTGLPMLHSIDVNLTGSPVAHFDNDMLVDELHITWEALQKSTFGKPNDSMNFDHVVGLLVVDSPALFPKCKEIYIELLPQHDINWVVGSNRLSIGCTNEDFHWWLAFGREVGQANDYSEDDIELYSSIVNHLINLHDDYHNK